MVLLEPHLTPDLDLGSYADHIYCCFLFPSSQHCNLHILMVAQNQLSSAVPDFVHGDTEEKAQDSSMEGDLWGLDSLGQPSLRVIGMSD